MKIKVFCVAGMSTSMLVTKMQKAAENRGLDVKIIAYPESELSKETDDCDIALLGPQVGFKLPQAEEICRPKNVPIAVILRKDYGMMDGEKVLDFALNLKEQ